jgi:hypothetical protein
MLLGLNNSLKLDATAANSFADKRAILCNERCVLACRSAVECSVTLTLAGPVGPGFSDQRKPSQLNTIRPSTAVRIVPMLFM